MGNKRNLLSSINQVIIDILNSEYQGVNREEIVMADLFSGSGVVARMMKTYAGKLHVNDFEEYSEIINQCYLTNKNDFNEGKFDDLLEKVLNYKKVKNGIIRSNYSPKDDRNIVKDDRCFYTNDNAIRIDTYRRAIDKIVPNEMKKFFLAPLLYKASVHVNTGGMFKGFYKDKETKIGKFGGTNSDSLKRILGKITIEKPILSDFDSEVYIYKRDTNELIRDLPKIDIAYIDSPYNQHSYGSNYFMLNLILSNKMPDVEVSRVSGIPSNWKSSNYCKKSEALSSMEDLVRNLNASWILISYNSEGIISYSQMTEMLKKYGSLEPKEAIDIDYSKLKSGRSDKQIVKKNKEYIFVLKKGI
ncbi:DNA adenine methyltransferase [Acholeplasma oculi]|uniref:DNA adenine methyltransferase n=1 Tax=Acholeplasma oculi TaxID=35623 RepID=A0A061AB74_9MOLU|nr:DNA adenine methyltransferase [Acholeplasma oculi]